MPVGRDRATPSARRRNPDSSLRAQLQRRGNREDAGEIPRHHCRDPVSSASPPEEVHVACDLLRRTTMRPDFKNIDDVVKQYLPSASNPDMQSDIDSIMLRL